MVSSRQWLKKPRYVAGIMSGTSLDGVDAVVARFHHSSNGIAIELLAHRSSEFPLAVRRQLLRIIEESVPIAVLVDTSYVLMHWYAQVLEAALRSCNVPLDAIGIHGQTLWHNPTPHEHLGVECRTTFQLASPAVLAAQFGVPVVSDVRNSDVVLGGQGAPLVPILDWELLRSPTEFVVALNIGGIANVTLLPAGCTLEHVRAFDTGPGNVWIDAAMQRYWGKRYDENGKTAAAGVVLPSLLTELQRIEFIIAAPPKSTGRELFSMHALTTFLTPYERSLTPAEDIVATLTAFTAWSIAENIRCFASANATIVVSGGGALNSTLLTLLKRELPAARIVRLSSYCGIDERAKEALLMAYLAYRTLGGLPSSIPGVTGAQRPAVIGSITPPP